MDMARCTQDGRTYYAVEFSALPVGEIAEKRQFLECVECGGPGFFRKASASGQAACFGARPHSLECSLRAVENEVVAGVLGVDDEIFNPGDRIVIDLNYGGAVRPIDAEAVAGEAARGRARRFVGDGRRGEAVMHRRLRSLLRLLVTTPNFRYAEQLIEVGNQAPLPARDFFVHLTDVTNQYSGQFRGYWGMLSHASFDSNGTLWLNSGGRADISFCIPADLIDEFSARWNINDEEALAGAYILVLGSVYVSQNNKLYSVINDLSMLAMRFN